MKASFTKKIAVACLSAVMAFGLGVGIGGLKTVNASSTEYDFIEIDSQYALNSTLVFTDETETVEGAVIIPKTISVDGGTATLLSLTFPNGVVKNVTDSKVVLSALGKYSVSYRFVKDSSSSILHEDFVVNNLFVEGYNGAITEKYTEDSSLKTTLVDGSKVTFNKLVDLRNVDENGFCSLLTVKMDPYANYSGGVGSNPKVSTVEVDVIDALDPTNYFTIVFRPSSNGVGYYLSAKSAKSETSGLMPSTSTNLNKDTRVVYINGKRYISYINYAGEWATGSTGYYDFRFNPETLQVMSPNQYHSGIFCDLDLKDAFREGAELFNGFKGNQVYLSIRGTSFTEPEIYTYVKSIGNVSGDALYDCFDNEVIEDSVAPAIKINAIETFKGAVYGKYNNKFIVPSAVATDANGCSEPTYKVYKNYSDTEKTFVNVNSDGSFTLADKVVYTIEYYSVDTYGNEAFKTLKVIPYEVNELSENYDYELSDNIQLAYNKFSLVTGQVNTQPIYAVADTINDKSKLNLDLVIKYDGNVVYEQNYNIASNATIPALNYQPLELGEYEVTYTISDNMNTYVSSYVINSTADSVVAFNGVPLTYTHYIRTLTYDLPDFTAYAYGNNVTPADTKVYVEYNNDEIWEEITGPFVVGTYNNGVKVENPQTIKFKFSADGTPDYITAPAKIVDVSTDGNDLSFAWGSSNMDITKYFLGNFDAVEDEENARFVFDVKETSGSSTLRFVNPLSFDYLNNFFFSLYTDASYTKFSELTISLIDVVNPDNAMNVNYSCVGSDLFISVNGGDKVHSTEAFYDTEISLKYNYVNKRITTYNQAILHEFYPECGKFYLEITLGNISGENAGVAITAVANQIIDTYTTEDGAYPLINYKTFSGTYPIDTEVTVYAPVVTDVLTPFVYNSSSVKFKVTVNKQPVYSKDNVKLDGTQEPRDYQLVLDKYATYRVDYYVTDVNGNETAGMNYRIICADQEAPVITLNYGFNENTIHNVTLGKPFTIDYSVSDNESQLNDLNVAVIIINDVTMRVHYSAQPQESYNGTPLSLITDTCALTTKGMYTVYIYAKDLAGNVSYATYKLNVQL